jgi:hypothetical protein
MINEVLQTVKEEKNIVQTTIWRHANWTYHMFHRNCCLECITEGNIEGRIEGTGRWGRRHKQPLDDLKEKRGYWKLKAVALDGTVWWSHFGRGCGPVVQQTTEWMNEWLQSKHFSTLYTYVMNVCQALEYS